MAEPDSNSGQNPAGDPDPLSATGMFLRSFDSAPKQNEEKLDEGFAKPAVQTAPVTPSPVQATQGVPPSATQSSAQSEPGEFTRAFQALDVQRPITPTQPSVQAPPESSASTEVARPATPSPPAPPPSSGPGEFTRIFVRPPTVTEQPVRPVPTIPTSATLSSGVPRLKGFSSPGVSDSASAEGSFTQIFGGSASTAASAPPASASPAPTLKVPAVSPPAPVVAAPVEAAPPKEFSWEPEPKFGGDSKPMANSMDRPDSSPDTGASATGLLSKLSGTGSSGVGPSGSGFGTVSEISSRPLSTAPDWGESRSSFPSFSSAPSTPAPYAPPKPESSSEDLGSVTRLIRRLSEDVRVPSSSPAISRTGPIPADAFTSAAPPAAEPAPPVESSIESGPGEFTRMISGESIRAALGGQAPAAPAPAPSAVPPPAPAFAVPMPAVSVAKPAVPAVPTAPAVPAMAPAPAPVAATPVVPAPSLQVPKVEAPKVAAPNLPPPAAAAPKTKLQEMLPLLLVVNTFLLIVLIVVVIFALRSR